MSAAEPDRRIPERFRFWQGQALLSRDLNDVTALAALMKGWHNRTLHDAFGVAEGLGVRDGGDGSVVVGPGTAYDIRGHPIVLDRDRSIAFPPPDGKPAPRLLVARRASGPGGAAPFHALALAWVAPAGYRPTLGPVLAEVEAGEGGLAIRAGIRRPVHAERWPVIGFGATVLGGTDWQNWSDTRVPSLGGLQVTVDTSAAGFTATPCYFTALRVTGPSTLGFLGQYWERIVHAGPTRFTLSLWLEPAAQVLFALRSTALLGGARMAVARRGISVAWVGIQESHRAAIPPGHDSEGGVHVVT